MIQIEGAKHDALNPSRILTDIKKRRQIKKAKKTKQ